MMPAGHGQVHGQQTQEFFPTNEAMRDPQDFV